ncbi:unnamed protein product [Calicophoron daubneyi]|uniref:Tektin n=1 Tax=Calicophoron daubneyi TaxID=300641 RepID=A0AAV2SXD1_CALDB
MSSENAGGDSTTYQGGISTIGLRSAKYTPAEWMQYHESMCGQAAYERGVADRNKQSSSDAIKTTEAVTDKIQADSTKRIKERLHDILFWKQELEREICDITSEIQSLIGEKRRLERALLETEFPLLIATENLNIRDCRRGIDKVADKVEFELLKELDIIQNVQELLKKAIGQAENQIAQERSVKELLEMNWSDKMEDEELDTRAGNLTNGCTNKQFYSGVALFHDNMSTPESWAAAAHDIIRQSETERIASQDLRSLIGNLLTDTSRDLRTQYDNVLRAFKENVDNLTIAKVRLECELQKATQKLASKICVCFVCGPDAAHYQKLLDKQSACDITNLPQNRANRFLVDPLQGLSLILGIPENLYPSRFLVVDEISLQERSIAELREAIRAKDDPLKVAQTRLHIRNFRPNMELCKDPAMSCLVSEVDVLTQSLDELLNQAAMTENKLKDLHDRQMELEKEIELKKETIYIDEIQCLPKRRIYPSALRLQGFN